MKNMVKVKKNSDFNIFIKKFDTIRSVFNDIYIYSCYDRSQFAKIKKLSERKYDNELSRLKSVVDNRFFSMKKSSNGSYVVGLKYDRYYNVPNYLVEAYKLKSFSAQDINLHFFILQILQKKQSPLSIQEIIMEIQSQCYNEEEEFDDAISQRMIRDKLFELKDIGFVEEVEHLESKAKMYKVVDNMLCELSSDELSELHQVLHFFRGISNIPSIPLFAQETIEEFINYYYGDECDSEDIYLYKNVFLSNILNDESIIKILYAIEEKKKISFDYKATVINAVPLKIVLDKQYGRQYLFCYDQEKSKPSTYIIDDITNVKINEYYTFESTSFLDCLSLLNKFWSLTQMSEVEDPLNANAIKVEIDFYINDQNAYILERLMNEKRFGSIQQTNRNSWLFSIEVIRPEEMIPWIRSFGEYAMVRKSEHHDLKERIELDWGEVKRLYGIL